MCLSSQITQVLRSKLLTSRAHYFFATSSNKAPREDDRIVLPRISYGRAYSTSARHTQHAVHRLGAAAINSDSVEATSRLRWESIHGAHLQGLSDDQDAPRSFVSYTDISPEDLDALATESQEARCLVESLTDAIAQEMQPENRVARELNKTLETSNANALRPKVRPSRYDFDPGRQVQTESHASSAPKTSYKTQTSCHRHELGHQYQEKRNNDKDEREPSNPRREAWMVQKETLKAKFPEGWAPRKRLSPDALEGIRALHAQMPERYTTSALAQSFQVSPEVIRKILKSKWKPSPTEQEDRVERWSRRGQLVWARYAELGAKPPAKWRQLGIGKGKPEKRRRLSLEDVVITSSKKAVLDTAASASDALEREVHSLRDDLSEKIL